jgi:hypothetical protein
MLKILCFIVGGLLFFSPKSLAESNEKVTQIFYCADDFAIRMDTGNWYVVRLAEVGEKKFDHFLSISMTLLATGNKTANVFPGQPLENWCGNKNFRPITILSITNNK